MSQSKQAPLSGFVDPTETHTEEINRTVVAPLETSERKRGRLEKAIDEWQDIAGRMADLMPSFDSRLWQPYQTTLWRTVNEEFDYSLKAHTAHEAAFKVAEAFGSWDSNGRPSDEHPGRPFGTGDYIRFDGDSVEIDSNERGFGVKLGIEPRKPEWFHINTGQYQNEYFENVVGGDADTATAEAHLTDTGANLHIVVQESVEVYDARDVPRYVGVDLGENVLYSAAVVERDTTTDSTEIKAVDMERGNEFRHYREKLTSKRDRLASKGDLKGVKNCRGDRRRYTEQVVGEASRSIVNLAVENAPCGIVLENLTNYRKSADDPIHDWPFAELQEAIMYKAEAEGIPVETVNPEDTSTTCRKCGQKDPNARNGTGFECRRCGYEVHADVNAAINIGLRATKKE